MITHISFDLDGTLITGDLDHIVWNQEIPRRVAEQHHVPLELATEHVYAEYYKSRYIEHVTQWTSIDYWFERFHLRGIDDLHHLAGHAQAYVDTIPALDHAAQAHTLILFTANDERLLDLKLVATGIAKYFTHIISVPARYGKKDSNAYRQLLRDLRLPPKELLHVGDDRTEDHDAPRAAGIDTRLIDRDGRTASAIASLLDLRQYLDEPPNMLAARPSPLTVQNIFVPECEQGL